MDFLESHERGSRVWYLWLELLSCLLFGYLGIDLLCCEEREECPNLILLI